MLSMMLGFGIVSRVASGFIADRIGGVRTLLLGSVLQGTALGDPPPKSGSPPQAFPTGVLVLTASELPPPIRGRVHLKAFGYHSGKGCGSHDMPFKHGQFNDDEVPFWRFGFWVPDGAGCTEVRTNPALATKE